MSSWSVDTNRVALTNVNTMVQNKIGNDEAIADFKDIADVARQSKGDSHIRAKQSGDGIVVYGRKAGWRNLFNKSDPSRQLHGAEQVKKSLEHFVKDKSPATKELVANFLSKYTSKDDGSVHTAMTNESITELADEIDKIENRRVGLQTFASDLGKGKGLDAFSDNLASLRQLVAKPSGYEHGWQTMSTDKQVAYAEFSTGVALAVIKDIQNGGEIGNAKDVIWKLYDKPLGWMVPESVLTLFSDFAQHNDRDRLVEGLCDLVKNRWFVAARYDSDTVTVGSSYDKSAPMFLSNPETRDLLVGYDTAQGDDKLDKLVRAFEHHLDSQPERLGFKKDDDLRNTAPSNRQVLIAGFDKILTAIRMT